MQDKRINNDSWFESFILLFRAKSEKKSNPISSKNTSSALPDTSIFVFLLLVAHLIKISQSALIGEKVEMINTTSSPKALKTLKTLYSKALKLKQKEDDPLNLYIAIHDIEKAFKKVHYKNENAIFKLGMSPMVSQWHEHITQIKRQLESSWKNLSELHSHIPVPIASESLDTVTAQLNVEHKNTADNMNHSEMSSSTNVGLSENELKEILSLPIEQVITTLKSIYECAKTIQNPQKTSYEWQDVLNLRLLEKQFNHIYSMREPQLVNLPEHQQVLYWSSMMTVTRFRAEKQSALPANSHNHITQLLYQTAQDTPENEQKLTHATDKLTQECRNEIVILFRNALSEYQGKQDKVRDKACIEKNPRYQDVYKTSLALSKKIDLGIILFEDGGSIDNLITCYQEAFNTSRDQFKINRSDPWFRTLISFPFEQFKQAINKIALTYYRLRSGEIPLDQSLIDKPFFKKSETDSTKHANKLDENLQNIIKTKGNL